MSQLPLEDRERIKVLTGPVGVLKGNINYAGERGSFPGCTVVELHADENTTCADTLNSYGVNNPGSTIVDLIPVSSHYWVAVVAPFMNAQEVQDITEYAEIVQEIQAERKAEREKKRLAAEAELRKKNEELKAQFDAAQAKLRDLAVRGERCLKNHKKEMPVDEGVREVFERVLKSPNVTREALHSIRVALADLNIGPMPDNSSRCPICFAVEKADRRLQPHPNYTDPQPCADPFHD